MNTIIDQNFKEDEIMSEVRRYKQYIASEHGFDVAALGRALQAREASDPRFKKHPPVMCSPNELSQDEDE